MTLLKSAMIIFKRVPYYKTERIGLLLGKGLILFLAQFTFSLYFLIFIVNYGSLRGEKRYKSGRKLKIKYF